MIATQSASVRSPACLDVHVPVHYFTSGRPVRCRAELRLLLERALRRVGAERADLKDVEVTSSLSLQLLDEGMVRAGSTRKHMQACIRFNA